jgi:hypothetical protein
MNEMAVTIQQNYQKYIQKTWWKSYLDCLIQKRPIRKSRFRKYKDGGELSKRIRKSRLQKWASR